MIICKYQNLLVHVFKILKFSGSAASLKMFGCRVIVTEIDPINALQSGFKIFDTI